MRRLLVLPIAAGMIGLAVPGSANADANDDSFIASLKSAGITFQSPEAAISAGRSVCDMMDQGATGADVVDALRKKNPGITTDGAERFTAIAARAYCPNRIQGGGGGGT